MKINDVSFKFGKVVDYVPTDIHTERIPIAIGRKVFIFQCSKTGQH